MPDVFDVLRRDHDEVKAILDRLEQGPKPTGGVVPAQLRERKRLVDELIIEESSHEAVEQQHFWPAVRELGPDGERLGDKITAAKKTAPTRPHPATPPKQGAQKTAGPMAAAADRLRDALTGRGKHR